MKLENYFLDKVVYFQEGPGVRKSQFTDKGIKLLNVGNINNGNLNLESTKVFISESEAYGKYSHFLVDEGDLIIASSGIVVSNFHNKIAFVRKEHLPLCLNTSVIRFKTLDHKRLSINYFKFFLKTNEFKSQLSKLITGSAQLNFGPSHLKKIKIPLPTISDQIKIAEILTKAEALIAQRKQSIALLDDYLKSTFLDMFGDPVKNEKGWEMKRLDKIAKLERGRFSPRPRNDPSYFDGDFPFIQTGDISNSGNRLNKYTQTLNEKGIKVSKKFNRGTIVIAIVGATIGATAILEIDVYATDSIIGINTKAVESNNYFLEFIMQFWKPVLLKNAPEAARPNINLEILNRLGIISPPLPLQNQFATKVYKKVELLKKQYQQSLVQLEALFGSLSQKGFKGELNLKGNSDFKFNPALERDIEVPARIKFKKTIKLEDEFTKEKAEEDDYIIKHLGKWLKIKPAKVKYVEANKPYVTIVYENDMKYLVRTSMNDFLKEKLFKDILIRVHQSIAVNKNQIQKIKTITTLKGEELLISIKNKKIVYNNSFTNSTENKKKNPIIDLLPILGKSTNLPFNYNEGKSIVKKYFSKKTGFSFKEFKDTVIKVGFTATFTDLKNFIFEALNEKILIQFYASKEWMQSITNMQYSSHGGAEFVGDGSIWFLVPQNVVTK